MSDRNSRNRDRSSSYGKKQDNYRPNYNRSEGGDRIDKQRKYEEYAWTLAYLSEGSPTDPNPFSQREAVIQAIGEIWFTLLELTPRRGVNIQPLVRIGIGKENRKVISRIKRRIGFDDLASSSERVLEECIVEIVNKQEFRFVNWFNKASLVTSRMHSFKLLPGIGTTHLENLISERTKVSDPRKLIIARIMKELTNQDEKYRLFTRKP